MLSDDEIAKIILRKLDDAMSAEEAGDKLFAIDADEFNKMTFKQKRQIVLSIKSAYEIAARLRHEAKELAK